MSRTIEQHRAAFALDKVQGFAHAHPEKKKCDKMHTHINNTPIRILNNGLGQALAFLQADNEGETGGALRESGKLYGWLGNWLCGSTEGNRPCRVYQGNDLIGQMMAGDRDHYMRAQEEALALFTWLKKFADAYLPGGQASQEQGDNDAGA